MNEGGFKVIGWVLGELELVIDSGFFLAVGLGLKRRGGGGGVREVGDPGAEAGAGYERSDRTGTAGAGGRRRNI